jgi:hypothetical protein
MNKEQKLLTSKIATAYHIANTLTTSFSLENAFEVAHQEEKTYRRNLFFTEKNSSCVSAKTCAQYFALRAFITPKEKRSFDVRLDFLLGYKAGERLEKSNKEKYDKFCVDNAWIFDVDYISLIEAPLEE